MILFIAYIYLKFDDHNDVFSIGFEQFQVERADPPHGNCVHIKRGRPDLNMFENMHNVSYTDKVT